MFSRKSNKHTHSFSRCLPRGRGCWTFATTLSTKKFNPLFSYPLMFNPSCPSKNMEKSITLLRVKQLSQNMRHRCSQRRAWLWLILAQRAGRVENVCKSKSIISDASTFLFLLETHQNILMAKMTLVLMITSFKSANSWKVIWPSVFFSLC